MSDQTIKEIVQEEVKVAMRAKDKARLGVLRLIMSEFKRIEVDERIVLDHTRELAVLDKMQKQRRESIAQYQTAKRDDLVAQEQLELDIIQSFKPAAMSDDKVQAHIVDAIKSSGAASAQDMGKVMAILKPLLQGKADIGQVSAKVKALLSEK